MAQEIDIRATIAAPVSDVWAVVNDSSTWPSWTPIDSYVAETPAGDDGLGEVRVFRNGRYKIREEIVERIPERRYTYSLLSGLALKDYRAEIDFEPSGDGATAIRWHTTFKPKVPGFGAIYRKALEKATQQFVDGLKARFAEQAGSATAR